MCIEKSWLILSYYSGICTVGFRNTSEL